MNQIKIVLIYDNFQYNIKTLYVNFPYMIINSSKSNVKNFIKFIIV